MANPALPFGLRTVDGSCNNLQPGQETFGAADQTFPRMTTRPSSRGELDDPGHGPGRASRPHVVRADQRIGCRLRARTISNLIVDQTSANPAAVPAAGFPVRTQGNEGVVPCQVDPIRGDPDGEPNGCVPSNETLFIPNVTTDFGLSPPYNSLFTIFGQFFDHGLDKITNGGNGTVFVPLKADDPLVVGGPGRHPRQRRRSAGRSAVHGADTRQDRERRRWFRTAPNTDSPFVDQSQTYTSHPSHQVFLRDYALTDDHPISTGKFLSSADDGLATWAMIKDQAATSSDWSSSTATSTTSR